MRMPHDAMSILVTLNAAYLPPLKVMLHSLCWNHPGVSVDVYVLHTALTADHLRDIASALRGTGRVHGIPVDDARLDAAPVTNRYPREMYYRLFAAQYLPAHLERVVYLDPDVVVKGRLDELFTMELGDCLYAAASHVKEPLRKLNALRLDQEEGPYINSGVMVLNLPRLRAEQDIDAVFRYIEDHRRVLMLPDQDVISGLYGERIRSLDPYRFNMTERLFVLRVASEAWLNLDWVRTHTAIVHYCGRNKPWKETYRGKLDVFYREAAARLLCS